MAVVKGRRRRLQIASAGLVLVVAASAGIGQGASAEVSAPDSRAVVAETTGKAEVATVAISSEAVRAFRVQPEPKPDPPADKKPAGKVIYLTFDDGPSTYTKPILNLLDEYEARATFFLVGENTVRHPNLARAVVARGHAVGNHTWSHRDMRRLKPRRLKLQITRTSQALDRITGQPVTCLRPPYGAVNGRVRSVVRDTELAMKLWDIDTRDWKRPGAAVIGRKVVSKARTGAVVLMHDGGGNRSQSVRALERILRTLSKKGYAFETLPGC